VSDTTTTPDLHDEATTAETIPELTREIVSAALMEALGSAGDPTFIVGRIGVQLGVVWANRAFAETVRAEVDDLAMIAIGDLMVCPHGALPLNERRSDTFPVTIVGRDGSTSSWQATAIPTTIAGSTSWVVGLRPPSADGQLDELLRASEERFRALAERAPIGIFSSEVGLRFGYVNDGLAELVKAPSEKLLGTGWMDFVMSSDLDHIMSGLQSTLEGVPFDTPARLITADGEERWVNLRAVPVRSVGTPAAFLGTIEDVTDRRRFEDLLAWQASHDPLTRLPNRAQLMDEITSALADGTDDLAVLFFDLDDFKIVNDTLGHRAGDELLVVVSTRLRNTVRDQDHVFRFAGDEFVVLARGVDDDAQALGVANRLREQVTQAVMLEGQSVSVGCSVGVVRASRASTADEMIRDADVAMYRAKRGGKGSAAIFDITVRSELDRNIELIARVRAGFEQELFGVAYRVSATSDSLQTTGVDLTLTLPADWDDTDDAEIAAVIEEANAHDDLIAFLIARGASELGQIQSVIDSCRVSIGITARQLLTPGLIDKIARTLLARQLASRDLELRVPEDAWDPLDTSLVGVVAELAELGIGISLDEVGAGRSSLTALGHPAISSLRLAPALLDPLSHSHHAAARAIVTVAHELGRTVSAPVSSDADLAQARALGADAITDSTQPAVGLEALMKAYGT